MAYNVCCLISGGKDGTYSAIKATSHGHKVVALANLFQSDGNELDSWMYQTVATDAVLAYASCFGLPLVRLGIPSELHIKSSELSYHSPSDEINEVEILYALLYKVKQLFPQVNAVTTGAILSNYQRLRVEHVCSRLGLISLSYLWEKNQQKLLAEMIDSQVDAILVKVACMGLTQKHLAKTLAQMFPILCSLHTKFGVHICGEGGEFESFTLDCPLFKKKIVLKNFEIISHVDCDIAPVAYIKINQFELQDKEQIKPAEETIVITIPAEFRLEIPAYWEGIQNEKDFNQHSIYPPLQLSKQNNFFSLNTSNIMGIQGPECSLEQQILGIFSSLLSSLNQNDIQLRDICFVNVYIRSLQNFGMSFPQSSSPSPI